MRPTNTIYRLAHCPRDYSMCHRIAHDPVYLSFPTVVAEREGEIIGFFSTNRGKYLIAGPLVVSKGGAITAFRLAEAYDNLLRASGMTHYFLATEPERSDWISSLGRLYERLPNKDGKAWFKRTLRSLQ